MGGESLRLLHDSILHILTRKLTKMNKQICVQLVSCLVWFTFIILMFWFNFKRKKIVFFTFLGQFIVNPQAKCTPVTLYTVWFEQWSEFYGHVCRCVFLIRFCYKSEQKFHGNTKNVAWFRHKHTHWTHVEKATRAKQKMRKRLKWRKYLENSDVL